MFLPAVLREAERDGVRCGGPVILAGLVTGVGLVQVAAGPLGLASRNICELVILLVLQLVGPLAITALALLAVLAALLGCWRILRRWLLKLELRRDSDPWPLAGFSLHLLQNATRSLMASVLLLFLSMAGVALFAIPGQLPTAFDFLLQPGGVLLKVLVVGILAAGLRFLLGFLLAQWLSNVDVQPGYRARRQQRYRSIRQVLSRLVDIFCIAMVTGWVLLDIPGVRELSSGALLASGAFLGALALVFQGLLRDFVAGLVMLFDDRYAIGDFVEIGGLSGEVVDLGVLSTELRCLDQRVVVIQNSSCEQVVNHSKLRSGAEIKLVLSHDCTDLPAALAVIGGVLTDFAADPSWKGRLLDKPWLRGVSAVAPLGITVSVVITTEAGAQGACERELLQRFVVVLRQRRIPLVNWPFDQRS